MKCIICNNELHPLQDRRKMHCMKIKFKNQEKYCTTWKSMWRTSPTFITYHLWICTWMEHWSTLSRGKHAFFLYLQLILLHKGLLHAGHRVMMVLACLCIRRYCMPYKLKILDWGKVPFVQLDLSCNWRYAGLNLNYLASCDTTRVGVEFFKYSKNSRFSLSQDVTYRI
jgi:hypothetical protein